MAMTATLTLDENGRLFLPEAVCRALGMKAGEKVTAEVSSDRIEITKEVPSQVQTTRSASGRVVVSPSGIVPHAGEAVRQERAALALRGGKK